MGPLPTGRNTRSLSRYAMKSGAKGRRIVALGETFLKDGYHDEKAQASTSARCSGGNVSVARLVEATALAIRER